MFSQLVRGKAFFGTAASPFGERVFTLLISSAIIEDIKNLQGPTSAVLAYYYFDFKDDFKRSVRGLLASLLFQLGEDPQCWSALRILYTACRDGTEQASDAALAKCLKNMLELRRQIPIFVIMDALDECPGTTGTPSARQKVLNFVKDIVGSNHPNLYMCITSRPEHDIRTVLNPMTSPTQRVYLHDESGQQRDIAHYIHSFVHNDPEIQKWRQEDKELVINTLSERAHGM
jgi:hypothetical protein